MNFYQFGLSIVAFSLFFVGNRALIENADRNEEILIREDGDIPFSDYRLPRTVIPITYEIMITPRLEDTFDFEGITHILVYVKKPTDIVTLHHGDIRIETITVTNDSGMLDISTLTYNSTTEKYEIKLKNILKEGANVTLNFQYSGKIRDDMIGFYRSSYIDSNGEIKWLASTQFQTTHARHAFPCFDEPSFKATFLIRIKRSNQYSCLSNMPLNRTISLGNNQFWDEFEESIAMSTYLVAFAISNFNYSGTDNFKVWARPNAIEQTQYALSTGQRALDHLSKLFKCEYQISKMDMMAVPDFSAGAMENWALITYRESRLLYDKDTCSDAVQQSIASVIVHEMTHMWFGNMVTPEWWSYLWLSEAFARYFQYFATAQIEKSWNMEEQFLVEQYQTALVADGFETSQPMTRSVASNAQASGVGDTITYNKGASIVRMMNLIFGQDVFDATLQNYLRNKEESRVARPEDLWVEFQNEMNLRQKSLPGSIEEIMSTWTTQAGYPVINVFVENGMATLRQERFFLRNFASPSTNATWWIPIAWTSEKRSNFDTVNVTHWMNNKEDKIKLDASTGWVILNVRSAGFYRVNYDNDSWYRIINALNSENYRDIHVLNRAALIDDLLSLARAGSFPYKIALDGLRYIRQEKNYLPFKSAFSGLAYLDQRFCGYNRYYELFKKFVRILIEKRYEELGYLDHPTDDRSTILLRSELNKWACNYGHNGCVETFVNLFQQWKNSTATIKPNQRAVAYCTGIRHGNEDDWKFLWNQYFNSNSAAEQTVILQALGCTEDTKILESYLLHAIESFDESRIRKQDSSFVFSAVHGSGISGAEFVLNFLAKYLRKIEEYYNGTSPIASILASASQRFSTQHLVDKFESFIETNKVEFQNISQSLNNSLNIAKYELHRFEEIKEYIISWINTFIEENEKTTPTPVTTTTEAGSNSTDDYDEEKYRLPSCIIPNSYLINLKPYIGGEFANFTFDGRVKISAQVAETTTNIILHLAEIIYHNIQVFNEKGIIPIASISIRNKYDFLVIELNQILMVGDRITIDIHYSGYLNEEMRGFYRSWYKDNIGNKRWLAATHLEPVAARKVFPCFDEPALKATFTIETTIPRGYSAISNMPIQSTIRHENGEITVRFQETPKMSTYLVALVVSDFTSLGHSGSYSVYARPRAVFQAEHALSAMEPLVTFYERALKIPYQLLKLDMVALPDFTSGAMENWGLLIYKERNLLYDANESTVVAKQSITNVVAHEISHQWFGNLVTPLWWKYLWLSEGFARYFQYFGTANIEPNWSLEAQFVVDQLHSAFESDSSASSHAMTHDVYSPTEIRAIFDSISYAKGASVIRMLEKSFGQDVFYKSLQNYLEKHRYNVVIPEDLFDAFEEGIPGPIGMETDNKIHAIMNTWTTQPGYPVVHVKIRDNRLYFNQERFFIKQNIDSPISSTWYVPITWATITKSDFNDTSPKYWLKNVTGSIEFPGTSDDLLIFNVQQSGFYRTNYDNPNWERIISFLKTDRYREINVINRAALIDDLMNFGRTGYVDYDIVLSATQYLNNEVDYAPWRAFFNGLTYLRKHFQGTDVSDAYKRYVTAILTPIYERHTFEDREGDRHITKLLKMHVRKWACEVGISDCEFQALKPFQGNNSDLIDPKKVPPNQRDVSYCMLMKKQPHTHWKGFWDMYRKSNVATDQSVILQSLACATEKTILYDLLRKAVSKSSDIRPENSFSVFTSVIDASLEGVNCVMDFIKDNYDAMVEYYGDVSKIKSIISALGYRLSTDELYNKYIDLINWLGEKNASIKSSLKSYKSAVEDELNWTEKYIPKIQEWLEKNYLDRNYRLPRLFSPIKYNVFLSPYFEEGNFTFTGRVEIGMKRLESRVSRIVLNIRELLIKDISVYKSDSNLKKGERLEVSSYLENKVAQTLSIFTKTFIKSDYLIVHIEFTGYLNDRLEGFYRSYYLDDKRKIRWLATTQFEPTHARSAFPCFDEPAYKARFTINVERPNDYVALSNMPSAISSPSSVPGRKWETFEESVKMSPYLIAFIVCDFKIATNMSDRVKVWGRPNIAQKGEYAEIAGVRMLELLSAETEHEYELPKLDLIGIPDFSMGAMENWGLATFREYGLFYDHTVTTAKYTDYILTIIAHELSHMWYGNLVTCKWWEYIWLNEGFAEYMQWRIAHLYRPAYGFEDLFVVDELQVAMQNDDYSSTHPMNNPVDAPSEIAKIFDTVTYGKSASVIRMIRNSMDPDIFAKAMRNYLSRYKYNSTTPTDLWNVFDDAIKETQSFGNFTISMETLMHSWTNERGYPVVSAVLNNNQLTLTQELFSFSSHHAPSNYYFWIPITMTVASEANFSTTETNLWLGENPLTVYIEKPDEWFVLNIQQSGYYRVNYDRDAWYRLFDALETPNHGNIHVTNRAQIVDDLLNLARGYRISYDLTLNGTSYLRAEKEYPPWKAFFNGINYIAQRYEGQTNRQLLGQYIIRLTSKQFERLGFVDSITDIHWDQLNRELLLTWNCKYNETRCVDTSKELFAKWRNDLSQVISPNARPAVYCTALRHGSEDDWNFLWHRYLETNFASEKKIILDALGCTENKDILYRYINFALVRNYTSNIRKQDVNAALASIYNAGQFGLETMLDFLLKDYRRLYEYYGEWDSVAQLFSKLASRFSTTEQIEKFRAFVNNNKDYPESILSTLNSALKTAEANYHWYSKSLNDITSGFIKFIELIRNGGVTNRSFSIPCMTILSIIVYILSQ